MPVPLFDCRVTPEASDVVAQVLASGQLATGPYVAQLEKAVSRHLDGREAVILSNMTQALELALRLAGVRPGDEVLTLSFNCLSSNSAIHNVGATPVWVDIDPNSASMGVADARACLTKKSRALVVYHLAGYPADAVALRDLCREADICLIEDANAAFGAILSNGSQVGSVGDYAVFSFYANRQVSGIEGAALICPDEGTAEQARRLRRYGIDAQTFRNARGEIDAESNVPNIGFSGGMTNVNAALAMENMRTVSGRLATIRSNVAALSAALQEVPGIKIVRPAPNTLSANWAMLLLGKQRERIEDALRVAGISTSRLHQPNHVYSGFGAQRRALPGTHALGSEMFAIPCGWWIDEAARTATIKAIYDEVT